MSFTVDQLLQFAAAHEDEGWMTLKRRKPFRFRVTPAGIELIPGTSDKSQAVPQPLVTEFCQEFHRKGSYSPGDYRDSFHKSYLLALIKRYEQERE